VRIATVVGARPQFIKAAAVSPQLRELGLEERLIHTGQHYDSDLSDRFFRELGLAPPDHNLGIGGGSHGRQTGRMLEGIEAVLQEHRADVVLVYGDTNSTLAGALAAAKLCIPVAHVEAGLRSFNREMPEEVNRVLTDHLADMLFVPTQAAMENLGREGITGDRVRLVGDVMYDLALQAAGRAQRESTILARLGLSFRGFVVATIHRAENTNDVQRLKAIVHAFEIVARSIRVVWAVHPRTRAAALAARLDLGSHNSITLIDPVGHSDMVALQAASAAVATDSGGMQKEAFFASRPCVTIRTETEWVELVEAGWNVLVDPRDSAAIAAAVLEAVTRELPSRPLLYGDGHAGALIARAIRDGA
jgi:UDP-GlcNAc3NAcA epimerase